MKKSRPLAMTSLDEINFDLPGFDSKEPEQGEKSWGDSGGAAVAPQQNRRKRADQLTGGDVIEWHGGSRTVASAHHDGNQIEIMFNDGGVGRANGSDAFEVQRNIYRKRLPKSMLTKSLRKR